MPSDDRDDRFREIVRSVPRGRVATYGQIAAMAGYPRYARHVGRALRNLPGESDVPWHRVINAGGSVSRRTVSDSHELQRMLLEAEGVAFDDSGRVPLEEFRWDPDDRPGSRFAPGPDAPES